MDEKFINDFRNEIKDCIRFDEFVNQHLALIISRIYHAGCAAQSIKDREAVGNLKTVRYNFYANEFGDAYLKSGVEAALAAAAIVENK